MQKSLRSAEGFSYAVEAGLPAVCVCVDLLQKLADGNLKLLVASFDELLRLVAYLEVRLKLGVLQIVTVACAVSDDRYSEIHRGILQSLPVDRCHGSRYGHTYYRTDLLVLVYPGRAVGVGVVVLAHKHDGVLVVASGGHVAYNSALDDLLKVFLSCEEYLDILVKPAAAIVTGVDDDTVAQVVFA